MKPEPKNEFELEASKARRSTIAECWHFVMESEKWWLFPILFIFLLLGLFMVLAASGAGPFIYTLF